MVAERFIVLPPLSTLASFRAGKARDPDRRSRMLLSAAGTPQLHLSRHNRQLAPFRFARQDVQKLPRIASQLSRYGHQVISIYRGGCHSWDIDELGHPLTLPPSSLPRDTN